MRVLPFRRIALSVLSLSLLGAGCEFQHRSGDPTSPSAAGPSGNDSSYVGTWQSAGAGPTGFPDPNGCSNFLWTVTAQASNAISGNFTATCLGSVPISGTGNGQVNGNTINMSLSGTASLQTGACAFSVFGTGIYEGQEIRVPYTGTTCLGPISGTETLRRGSLPGPPPPAPAPAPAPAPSPNRIPCALGEGSRIVECVKATFPEKLVPVGSLGERQANMAFIRDRIIEAGGCSGLNFGYNLKRGGPELSIDFLAWRRSGEDIGVDLGFDYDNLSQPLRLQWLIVGPGAFFAAYPMPPCG
jgi:hypothetical protein